MDDDAPADDLGHAGLAGVEEVDGLAHEASGILVPRLELGPPLPQFLDLGMEISHGARR